MFPIFSFFLQLLFFSFFLGFNAREGRVNTFPVFFDWIVPLFFENSF
jgi:hypothetical protein